MEDIAKCALCGEPMPQGEEMFKYHGYSGPCPKPPLPSDAALGLVTYAEMKAELEAMRQRAERAEAEVKRLNEWADGFSDRQIEERRTGEMYQRELKDELEALRKALQEIESIADADWPREASIQDIARAAMAREGE